MLLKEKVKTNTENIVMHINRLSNQSRDKPTYFTRSHL